MKVVHASRQVWGYRENRQNMWVHLLDKKRSILKSLPSWVEKL